MAKIISADALRKKHDNSLQQWKENVIAKINIELNRAEAVRKLLDGGVLELYDPFPTDNSRGQAHDSTVWINNWKFLVKELQDAGYKAKGVVKPNLIVIEVRF